MDLARPGAMGLRPDGKANRARYPPAPGTFSPTRSRRRRHRPQNDPNRSGGTVYPSAEPGVYRLNRPRQGETGKVSPFIPRRDRSRAKSFTAGLPTRMLQHDAVGWRILRTSADSRRRRRRSGRSGSDVSDMLLVRTPRHVADRDLWEDQVARQETISQYEG
jgi:hypothetical protein